MPSLHVGNDSVTFSGKTHDEIEPFAQLARTLQLATRECTVGSDGRPGLEVCCLQFPRAADLVDFLFALLPMSTVRT